jgi:hypothetical protein
VKNYLLSCILSIFLPFPLRRNDKNRKNLIQALAVREESRTFASDLGG